MNGINRYENSELRNILYFVFAGLNFIVDDHSPATA